MTSPPEPGGENRPALAPFTAVILAGQRASAPDPLALAAGVPNKSLVPIAGRALIAHVADALSACAGIGRLRIAVEPAAVDAIAAALSGISPALEFVAAAGNIAESVLAAADGVEGPIVVTTADNVLLTPDAINAMRRALGCGADVGLALARKASVLAAHPQGQRRFYRFSDDDYSNCNLYAFAGAHALAPVAVFRSGGQFAKKPLRLLAAIGPLDLLLFRAGRLSLPGAARRLSRRFGMRVAAVVLADGAHAIDVDNQRTYDAAAAILERRRSARGEAHPDCWHRRARSSPEWPAHSRQGGPAPGELP